MFYGREKELNIINSALRKTNNAILIYGKRRIGKTTLIKEAIKGYDAIYFECLEDTMEANIYTFIKNLAYQGIDIPSFAHFKSFIDIFEYLNSLERKMVIVIDEFPYLKTLNKSNSIDSIFQMIIDNHLTNLNLIVSGSQIRIMNELLQEGNALFGRFYEVILLEEFSYLDTAKYFYNDLSYYDKVAFYSVFGGSPYINEALDASLSLKENIIHTFLRPLSKIYNYADQLLLTDSSNQIQAKRIVKALENGKKKYSILEAALDKEKTGKINVALKSLLELKIIKKVYPINKKNDTKKSYYETYDNVLRFFYTYIEGYKSNLIVLGEEAFYNEFIAPSLTTYISHAFERISREYFSLLVRNNILTGIRDIGTYYYDDKETKTNGEFDVALETKDGISIYEVKYLLSPLNKSMADKELKQIEGIKGIKISKIGFISIQGFDFESKEYDLITGEQLYNIK